MGIHQVIARAALVFPDSVAINHDAEVLDWKGVEERVARLATLLLSKGLARGDRVAVLAVNSPQNFLVASAVFWAGLILVPLHLRLSKWEHQAIVGQADISLLCHDSQHVIRAREITESDAGYELFDIDEAASTASEPWQKELSKLPYCPSNGDSTAAIFFTGGTTGIAKGVELSHTALLTQGLILHKTFSMDRTSVYLHVAPMFHLADFATALALSIGGGTHTFMPAYSDDLVLDAIRDKGVNKVCLAPTMMSGLLARATERPNILTRLDHVIYGTAPISAALLQRFRNEAPGISLIQLYGQTELAGGCTALTPEFHVPDPDNPERVLSAGQPLPGFMVKIVDSTGQSVETGRAGEVWISGPCIMNGYWREPTLTAEALSGGWLKSGDIGTLDQDGFLRINGRLKDMIITGGENVFAAEVENVLSFHPAVETAAVIGVPHSKWGEAVHAVVVLRSNASVEPIDLIKHCQNRIARYKCPQSVEFSGVPLPLTAVGKVKKLQLLESWKARHEQ